MGVNSLVRSKGFKNFMSKLYGWGASVVILGALFKINHYPGAEIMLILGLGTEALIFFFSAFEPPHVEPDWSLVYPELAGLYEDADGGKKAIKGPEDLTQELDKMLEDAKIGPELIESLGKGLSNLSENAQNLTDISEASVATGEYVGNIKSASASAGELSNTYKQTAETLSADAQASADYVNNIKNASGSANELAESYQMASNAIKDDLSATDAYVNSIKAATDNAQLLADKYAQSAESLTKSAEAIDFSAIDGNAYNEQLQKISKNLSALNTVYELQIQEHQSASEANQQMQQSIETFLANLSESVESTAKYKDEVSVLAKNISSLNTVYGNMLTAMNANPNA